jgi:hypothetical protein
VVASGDSNRVNRSDE